MLVIREPKETWRIADSSIRALAERMFIRLADGDEYDWQTHGYIIVLEPGDTSEQLEQESGCPVLHQWYEDAVFGDPDFQPATEVLDEHPTCWELGFVVSDSGFAVVIYVPKDDRIDPEVRAMCAEFCTPPPPEVPRLLEPPAKYRIRQ